MFPRFYIFLSNFPFSSMKVTFFPLKGPTLNYTALSKISMSGFQ